MWLCARASPANTILLCLICPKAIIKLFVCTVLSLSLVIHFYKYSISLTSCWTPSFQKTISPSVTLFISVPSYELFFLFNYHAFLFFMFHFLEYKPRRNKKPNLKHASTHKVSHKFNCVLWMLLLKFTWTFSCTQGDVWFTGTPGMML